MFKRHELHVPNPPPHSARRRDCCNKGGEGSGWSVAVWLAPWLAFALACGEEGASYSGTDSGGVPDMGTTPRADVRAPASVDAGVDTGSVADVHRVEVDSLVADARPSSTTDVGFDGPADAGTPLTDGEREGAALDAVESAPPDVVALDAGAHLDAAEDGQTDASLATPCIADDGASHPAIMAMAANLGGGQSLAQAMTNSAIPGLSIAIRDKDGRLYAAVFGHANNQAHDPGAPPLSPLTRFQAASIGKPIVTLAYLMSPLRSATLDVDLRASLASWIVPPYALTPADLVSHSAGTAPHGFATGYAETDALPTAREIVLGTGPANSPAVTFDPNTRGVFSYSGGGFMLFQAWLEGASGRSLGDFVHANLAGPASAARTTFQQPLTYASDHDAACGKSPWLTQNGRCRKVYPELAAAGLWTTPTDLACMVRHVVVSRPEVLTLVRSRALWVDWDNGTYPQRMGLGLLHRPANGVDGTDGYLFEHSGVNEGFLSQMVFFDDGRALIAMDNGMASRGGISGHAVRALCRELGWPCAGKSVAIQ